VRIATVVVLAAMATEATAGRTHYGWLHGSEVIPERGVELETWILEENGKGPLDARTTLLLWGVVVGVTDQVELAFPVELTVERSDAMPDGDPSIARYGVEARWRMVSSDPVDAPPVVPLLRVAAKRMTERRDAARVEADLVVSYELDKLHVLADLGVVTAIGAGEDAYEVRSGAGATVRVHGDLRLGAEVLSSIKLRGGGVDWVTAGPTLAWTHGRLWLSANYGIGLYQIDNAPRLNVAIAF
jgi:hypothetical protein